MVVLGVENGSSGFEGVAGEGDSSHPASDAAAAFEDSDLADGRRRLIGVLAKEVSDGGAADAASDYADSWRIRLD